MNLLQRKWNWAKENPLFWFNLGLLVITASTIWIFPAPVIDGTPSDLRIRIWGMLLQLIGVYTVWHDLTSAGDSFGKRGFLKRTLDWLKRGFGGNAIVIAVGAGAIAISGGSARAVVRRGTSPNAPIADRVTDLEYNFQKLDEDLSSAYREIDKTARELTEKIKSESEERKQSVSVLENQLKDAVVGNFTVLAFGAVWLAIGVFIATVAPEIAKIVAGQGFVVWKSL